jgi:hypothetical protein
MENSLFYTFNKRPPPVRGHPFVGHRGRREKRVHWLTTSGRKGEKSGRDDDFTALHEDAD